MGEHRHHIQVSIHAPARGATSFRPPGDVLVQVSIHAPARGATGVVEEVRAEEGVSIHAPARGATHLTTHWTIFPRSFNPRARAGRDIDERGSSRRTDVSIHAPARGATGSEPGASHPLRVSIHAPARGATSGCSSRNLRGSGFNPRARAGRDSMFAVTSLIHPSFNPRARAGRDLLSVDTEPLYGCFNPRARAGRDEGIQGSRASSSVSIHAPARGATSACGSTGPIAVGFNPRARAGRDRPATLRRFGGSSFNPRARAGRDVLIPCCRDRLRRFQSTCPRGARLPRGRASS